nr:MAG TPA: hypothetical protein [Caudoviricetes sp.]
MYMIGFIEFLILLWFTKRILALCIIAQVTVIIADICPPTITKKVNFVVILMAKLFQSSKEVTWPIRHFI